MAITESQSDWQPQILQNRLAGITKLGRIIKTLPIDQVSPNDFVDFILNNPRGHKVLFGLTLFGGSSSQRQKLKQLPIQLKKALKQHDLSIRWITGEQGAITPAAIHKMHLTDEGYDFCLGVIGDQVHLGITESVQNPDDWSLRDYGRPARDARNGMLPPKLAHMMVNLALGQSSTKNPTLLDPFCGGGTILMEAALIDPNLTIIGSDLEAKQIADSSKNIDWLAEKHIISDQVRQKIKLITAPAEQMDKHLDAGSVDLIATEGYLGKPLRGHETQAELDQQKREIEAIWSAVLPILAKLQPKDGVLCLCLPSFQTDHAKADCHLNQALVEKFYISIDPSSPLTYSRENQFIKRNLLLFKRK